MFCVNFWEKEFYKVIFAKVYNSFDSADFISELCLWAFLAPLQKSKNKDFGGAILQKQYVFKRNTVKLCFEELWS